MSEIPFHQTVMGHRFFEAQLPALVRLLKRIAVAMERHNELLDRANDQDDEHLTLARRHVELQEQEQQCDCPECVARREAESQAKG